MKRVVKCLVLLMLLIIPVNSIDALSLSKNEVTLSNGGSEKIELYATSDVSLKRVDFNLVYSTYDIVGDFIVNSKYKDRLFYNKFDDNPKSIMRYIDWKRGKPYIFRNDDYNELINSEMLFARKFDASVDIDIINAIYTKLCKKNKEVKK